MGPLCRCGMCVDHVTRWLARSSLLYKCVTCMRQRPHYFAIIQCAATSANSNLIVCLACLLARYYKLQQKLKKIKRFVNKRPLAKIRSLSIFNSVPPRENNTDSNKGVVVSRICLNTKQKHQSTILNVNENAFTKCVACGWMCLGNAITTHPVHKQRDCKNKYEVIQSISILFGFH